MSTWPKEALASLGRPINRWDVCPTCGEPASGHVWKGGDELLCRAPFIEQVKDIQKWADDQRVIENARIKAEVLKEIERNAIYRQLARREAREATRARVATPARSEKAIATGPRKYFDE